MSEAPRKKRFQVHLSTAVVMMIAAGVLMWANFREQNWDESRRCIKIDLSKGLVVEGPNGERLRIESGKVCFSDKGYSRGWPTEVMASSGYSIIISHDIATVYPVRMKQWGVDSIIINALVGLAILFAMWFMCEWWIRRRAARK